MMARKHYIIMAGRKVKLKLSLHQCGHGCGVEAVQLVYRPLHVWRLDSRLWLYLREVYEADDLLRAHVRQHLPHRLGLDPAAEVPQAVHDPRHGHADQSEMSIVVT